MNRPIHFLKKQTNKQTILSRKNKTKISLEIVRHENDVHNSSKTIFILKKTFISFFFTNGANRPRVNRPVRKMVLERIVPGGTGCGANRPVTVFYCTKQVAS